MTYAFQGLLPVLNNDDVRQVQSPEVSAMVTQGRWLYSFLYHQLLDQNPLPGLSTFIGAAGLVGAAWLHAKLIGLRHSTSVLVLGVVSSISIYYGYMFDFDSTRIAYPLGNLVSAAGLVVAHQSDTARSRLAGVLLLSLGPALYPATLMYQVTLLISAALYWCVRSGNRSALHGVVRGLVSIVAGVVVYRILTTVLYAVAGYELDDRGTLNPLGLIDNWATIEDITIRNALPFLAPGETPAYFSLASSFGVLAVFVTFLVAMAGSRRSGLTAAQGVLLASGLVALLFSPFFMIAFTETDYYPIRSLYSFAAVYGALLAIAFERVALGPGVREWSRWLPGAVLVVAASFALVNASSVGQKSYDQALAWQTDVAQVNRVIYRIDEVLAQEPPDSPLLAPSAQIPIVVLGDVHWRSGPRGDAVSAWLHPWSKEYIFGLLDNRFVPATPAQRTAFEGAAVTRQAWPSEDSVFIEGGVVVVLR